MNVLPRLLASSRCPHNIRFLVGESVSSSIRHYSTNTPVSTKTPSPDDSSYHFSQLVKTALAQADPKKSKKKKSRKFPAKPISADSKKSKKKKSREVTAKPIPKQKLEDASEQVTNSQNLEACLRSFPTEDWVPEPWTHPQYDQRPADDINRSTPPHILEHKIISEGTLNPSETETLTDVPTAVEHLPVAKLCHGLERVLFKCVIYLCSTFLRLTNVQPRCPLVTRPAFEGI